MYIIMCAFVWLPEKINVFQKFKSSNAFYARARQMMLVTKRPAALHRS